MTKRNIRGLKGPKWTLAEKKVLLHCYHYSKFEKWSRSIDEIFRERVSNSNLAEERKSCSVKKLRSIISQVGIYITPEERSTIEKDALRDAENDYEKVQEEE